MGNKFVKLNKRYQVFADEYLIDLNATQAAIRAGYSKKTARSQGQRLLTNVDIQNYIQNRLQEKENDLIADQDEVLEFLTASMRGKLTEEVVSGRFLIEKKANIKERLKAAELLCKRYMLFSDKSDSDSVDEEFTIQIVRKSKEVPEDEE